MNKQRLLELAGMPVTESKWPTLPRDEMIELILEQVRESDWAPEEMVEIILKLIPDDKVIKNILEKHFTSSLEDYVADHKRGE